MTRSTLEVVVDTRGAMSIYERGKRLPYRLLSDRCLSGERYSVWGQSVPLRLHESLTLFQGLRRVRR